MGNKRSSSLLINLSDYNTSEHDATLLDKGLTFIPTTRLVPIETILTSRDRLIRSLKLRSYFDNDDDDDVIPDKSPTFRHRSTWTPRDKQVDKATRDMTRRIIDETDNFLSSNRQDGRGNLVLFSSRYNLSEQEMTSLRKLRSNPDIVIKPADKGGATVIMSRSSYIREAHRQLDNGKYYRKLDRPIYPDNIVRINRIVDRMNSEGFIDDRQWEFLRAKADTCRPRRFYLLPKIHKDRSKWPAPDQPEGRPIVSDCGSESYEISKYMDHHIRPLSTRHASYLRDTYDFVNKVRGKVVESNSYLVTGDVTALYTNMHHDRSIDAVRRAFLNNPRRDRPDFHILALLMLTLQNNDFTFDNEFYLQVCGSPMGKTYSPSLANLYLIPWDKEATEGSFRIKPYLFGRFLDDVFFVWTGTLDELQEFEDYMNSLIPDIKVKFVAHESRVDFLDTTVYKVKDDDDNTVLQTKVFFKETDTHQLLHRDSFHPRHTTKGILTSQLLRFKRISSCKADYDEACSTLFRSLRKRGYSSSMLRKRKREIWSAPQQQQLKGKDSSRLLPIVVPYSRQTAILARNWKAIVTGSQQQQEAANSLRFRLITAFTKGASLRNHLIRSKL